MTVFIYLFTVLHILFGEIHLKIYKVISFAGLHHKTKVIHIRINETFQMKITAMK